MNLIDALVREYEAETAKTRRMLEAIAVGTDYSFKPHVKSMALGRLAGHLTDMTGNWALSILETDGIDFPADHKWDQYVPANREELLAKFTDGIPVVVAAMRKLEPEAWDVEWKFVYGGHTVFACPRFVAFRDVVMNHMIHHRAQLGVYLRLLDQPVPGVYGPSADSQ
jgi:uncharacterized damage-inducible protein DinB